MMGHKCEWHQVNMVMVAAGVKHSLPVAGDRGAGRLWGGAHEDLHHGHRVRSDHQAVLCAQALRQDLPCRSSSTACL
jgi:hypothetical protein